LAASSDHLTTIDASCLSAQTSAMTHPIIVQPRRRFSTKIETASRFSRANAMIVGRKYRTNPNPKIGKKKNAKRCMSYPPVENSF
jgi:hypothetical protein